MNGIPEVLEAAGDRVEFKRPAHRGGVELYRARIVHQSFEPHTHEAFGFGVIDAGVERFRYRGADQLASAGSMVLMNPDELHTGRAETEQGWRYRMIYLDPHALAEFAGESGWWFGEAVEPDRARARRVGAVLQALWDATDSLAFDSSLSLLMEELRPHAQVSQARRSEAPQRFEAVMDFMRSCLSNKLSLDDLAAVAGLSPFHFLREFKRTRHVTPQQMLMALRLFAAKQRLALGQSAAAVAADVGLTDQAHLTRAFAHRYGVTPGRYQQQLGARPRPTL